MNKIPVLDKGYVALYATSLTAVQINDILIRYFHSKPAMRMLDTVEVYMEIRCPIFVQLILNQYNLTSFTQHSRKVEAYIPSINDISAPDVLTAQTIQQDIEQTTEALLINPKAYKADGCDHFVSQVITPINVYNTLMVSGSLPVWWSIARRDDLPNAINAYTHAIANALEAEYSGLREFLDGQKK